MKMTIQCESLAQVNCNLLLIRREKRKCQRQTITSIQKCYKCLCVRETLLLSPWLYTVLIVDGALMRIYFILIMWDTTQIVSSSFREEVQLPKFPLSLCQCVALCQMFNILTITHFEHVQNLHNIPVPKVPTETNSVDINYELNILKFYKMLIILGRFPKVLKWKLL